MVISKENDKFKALMQQAKNGDAMAYNEACMIVAKHVYFFVCNKYGQVDFDVIYALVDNIFTYRISLKGYDCDITDYTTYTLKTTYVKIEQSQLATMPIDERAEKIRKETGIQEIDKQTLIDDLIETIELKRDPSATDRQIKYAKLVKLLNNGGSFEEFSTKIYILTYGIINEYIKGLDIYKDLDEQEVQDLICDVIMARIRHSFDTKHCPERFYNWIQYNKRLLRLSLDALLTKTKEKPRNKQEIVYEEEADDSDLEEHVILQEQNAWIVKAINKLPEREKLIVQYRFIEGRTFVEIGNILNLSKQCVEQKAAKIRKKLAAVISKYNKETTV